MRVLLMTLGGAAAAAGPEEGPPGEWRMAARDFANTRYSALTEIGTANVSQLRVAWTFSTGVVRGHEAAPLVVGDTMYVVTPYPNILYALDLTKSGAVKWRYEPKPSRSAQGMACCHVVNRGAAYADGRISSSACRRISNARSRRGRITVPPTSSSPGRARRRCTLSTMPHNGVAPSACR